MELLNWIELHTALAVTVYLLLGGATFCIMKGSDAFNDWFAIGASLLWPVTWFVALVIAVLFLLSPG